MAALPAAGRDPLPTSWCTSHAGTLGFATPTRPGSLRPDRLASESPKVTWSRHAAAHGSARPNVTLGFTTPIRPGSLRPPSPGPGLGWHPSHSMQRRSAAPDRAWPSTAPTRTQTTLPNPNRCLCRRGYANCGRAEAPLWQVRGTCRRSNHVNLWLVRWGSEAHEKAPLRTTAVAERRKGKTRDSLDFSGPIRPCVAQLVSCPASGPPPDQTMACLGDKLCFIVCFVSLPGPDKIFELSDAWRRGFADRLSHRQRTSIPFFGKC